MGLDVSTISYFNFLKVILHTFKNNIELIKNSRAGIIGKVFAAICTDICSTFRRIQLNEKEVSTKFVDIQLKVIEEMQKLFPDDINGVPYMVLAYVQLEQDDNDTLCNHKNKYKNLLLHQKESPKYFAIFFKVIAETELSRKQFENFCGLALDVMDRSFNNKMMLNSLANQNETNFISQLIEIISTHPAIIHVNPKTFNIFVLIIVRILLSEKLEASNFRNLETALVRKMIATENYFRSFTCFNILVLFLKLLRSREAITQYFIFFQKLLKKIWNPSTEMSSLAQIFVREIFSTLMWLHRDKTRRYEDADIVRSLMKSGELQEVKSFDGTLESLIVAPTVLKYYELMKSLHVLTSKINSGEKTATDTVCEVITLVNDCDWRLHSGLVINLMDVMIATRNPETKLMFLVKFNPSLSKERSKSLEVNLKLLDLLFSFMTILKEKIGLRKLLATELNKMLMNPDDVILTRAMLKKFSKHKSHQEVLDLMQSTQFDHDIETDPSDEEILEILERSKGTKMKHKCYDISHAMPVKIVENNHAKSLQMILAFSQSLRTETICESDRRLVLEIIQNLGELAPTTNGYHENVYQFNVRE